MSPSKGRRGLIAAGVLAVAAPAGIVAASMLPAAAATTPVAGGVYTLASGSSGKCVDVTGASADNSALLIQTACDAALANHQWKAVGQANGQFNMANGNSGRCVDVPSSTTTSGTRLQ